jgi:hypothetical protein
MIEAMRKKYASSDRDRVASTHIARIAANERAVQKHKRRVEHYEYQIVAQELTVAELER